MNIALPRHGRMRVLRLLVRLKRWRWLMPVGGFLSGLAGFFLVERQQSIAAVLPLILMATWLWLLAENLIARLLHSHTGLWLPRGAVRFATQMIHQETLFFCLPFFLVSTTWFSAQAGFTVLLTVAALVSCIDPLYFGVLAARRWLFFAFHALCLFVMTLTAPPLILQLTTAQTYQLAVGALVAGALPSLAEALRPRRMRRWLPFLLAAGALGGAAWAGRAWVPPATLRLTGVALATQFDEQDRQPAGPTATVNEAMLARNGLYAYTAIRAPRGLHEPVEHVWYHEGGRVDRIELTVTGGRAQGYRSWSHKQQFPENAEGDWQIRVITGGGQLIGVLRFTVATDDRPGGTRIGTGPHEPAGVSTPIEPPH